jgi:hypothetical protein
MFVEKLRGADKETKAWEWIVRRQAGQERGGAKNQSARKH